MITLRLDKNGGINKGDIKAFEHDNLSEVYIIQLYKNGAIYDLTNKSIELTMVERKRKIGDMVTLPIYNATEGKIKLEVVSDITKQDGIFDFKLTVKDTTGLIETFPNFQVKIKNDITDSITGEIIQDPNFTILTDGLKALADYNIYKTNALKVPEIEQDIIEINSQLDNKASKNEIFTMDNMGQDIKEAMTGGSVAVVGTGAINMNNLNATTRDLLGEFSIYPVNWVDNGYYNSSGTLVSNNYSKTSKIAVTHGDKIRISGIIRGTVRFGAIITNSENEVIEAFLNPTDSNDLIFNNFEISIPKNSAYVLLTVMNEFIDNYKFEKFVPANKITYEKLSNDVQNALAKAYKEITNTLTWSDGYYDVNGNFFNNTFSQVTSIDVVEGEKFRVSFTLTGIVKYGVIIKNEVGNVLIADCQGTTSADEKYSFFEIEIPQNSKKLYLTVQKDASYIIEKLLPTDFTTIDFANNVNYFKNKKIVFYGDSITERCYWVDTVAKELGCENYINLGISSTMLATEVNPNYPSYDIETLRPGASDDRIATIPDDTDIITIMFGHNDCGVGYGALGEFGEDNFDTKRYYGAYNYLIQELYKKNKKIQIFIMTPPYSGLEDGGTDWHKHIEECRRISREIAYKYSLPLVETKENGINYHNRSIYHGDNSHMNKLGGQRMAQVILAKIKQFYYMP